ncbi:hypothetical protein SEA_OCTOBIEN14_141 [Gordonia phage Octobien14]|uniref:Uncharacterized protein n=1 Tax=Gordonia phage Octobien14 TaxID=2483673 RepID=A0A3G3MB38_9CAUD|nr:hypothetical protein L3Y22_gp103 [Gordonia phage Octobien14]AYR03288.1 hypothetical protein SEA_OCTOBIEN14_141 [Gordonia phage Octobien14]
MTRQVRILLTRNVAACYVCHVSQTPTQGS